LRIITAKIGEGGMGEVHHGQLPWEWRTAVFSDNG